MMPDLLKAIEAAVTKELVTHFGMYTGHTNVREACIAITSRLTPLLSQQPPASEGGEVEHWRTKAKCYGDIVHGCTPALDAAGFPVDRFAKDGAVGAIKRAVEAMAAQLAERDARIAALTEEREAWEKRWGKLREWSDEWKNQIVDERGPNTSAMILRNVVAKMDSLAQERPAREPKPERPPMLLAQCEGWPSDPPEWWAYHAKSRMWRSFPHMRQQSTRELCMIDLHASEGAALDLYDSLYDADSAATTEKQAD